MDECHVVRGYGPLDKMLARLRHGIVYRKLKPYFPIACCLDIGSGAYPAFLLGLEAELKYGLEQSVSTAMTDRAAAQGVTLVEHDLSKPLKMPFGDAFFDAITMTAVIEHIEPGHVAFVLAEVNRVLKPDGVFVLTTPAAWTDKLLRTLAFLKLISREEIEDHKDTFTQCKLRQYLTDAGFHKVDTGTFECFMNLWGVAEK